MLGLKRAILLLSLSMQMSLFAQQSLVDSLEVGLLTCEPGTEVYSLYGHTAIRVKNYTTHEDWVFNYGVFSFNQPHFLWRFVKGECDYQVSAVPFYLFEIEYRERGSSVYQQTLNMTSAEKNRLWHNLLENLRPENKTYRYNFLYDNCTTRARDMIEQAFDGKVVYLDKKECVTYRQILHEYTATRPWNELGNDICLGAEADELIDLREKMFAPFNLMHCFDEALVIDTVCRGLVLSKSEVVKGMKVSDEQFEYPSPVFCVWLLLAVVLALTLVELRMHKSFWWLDAILMTIAGVIGLVVTFLFFCSVHPAVDSNWQIWVFNPLPLLAMPWVVWCAMKKRKTRYHLFNACILIFFILFSPLIPQDFCSVVVPLAVILLLRSCSYMYSYRMKTKQLHAE